MTNCTQGKAPLISDHDRENLLKVWNNTHIEIPRSLCIHQLFEEQVSRTPDCIAVTSGGKSLTYRQLDSKANQMANYLLSQGIVPDTFIGVCIDRSLEMLIALLGILKAGGAYVPLDPEYPKDRLAYMLEDSKVSVLLSLVSMQSVLPTHSAKTVFLDRDWNVVDHFSNSRPSSQAGLNNLIYIIYTSGSTGNPKGTLVYHKGFVNLLHWYTSEFAFGAGTNTLLMTSTSFDLTQKNIFGPLICGGHLVLLDSKIFDASVIQQTIATHQITSINCTPSAFQGIVSDADEIVFAQLATLQQVFLGGESILVSRFSDWRMNPYCQAEVINSYGPTECTDVCAYYRLHDYDRYARQSVPIGRPICNTKLYILDSSLNLLPVGQEGELCIAGQGVGAGYLNRSDLTREKFISNPFSEESSDLIYKTGDRARFLSDGNIEYLGRIDLQVKIRGFRIELGEIEAAIDKHSEVKESVVLGLEDQSGQKRLVAYIVNRQDAKPRSDSIRKFLQNDLPDFMLPTAWVFLDAMPLTPNGKIDRNSLPSPQKKRPDLSQQFIPPHDDFDRFLADRWGRLLDIDRVGIRDPFFELGGTSIQAIQFIAQLGNFFKITIPIVHFFDAPTIEKFGKYLKNTFHTVISQKLSGSENTNTPFIEKELPSAPNSSCKKERTSACKPAENSIAIIGMAGRFPDAENLQEFWANLYNGHCAATAVEREDLLAEGFDPELLSQSDYVNICYPLLEHDCFDASFFGYTPKQAEMLDPQHRLFLEIAWAVLEDAGYDLQKCKAKVSIYGGVARNGYLVHNIASYDDLRNASWDYQYLLGNEKDFPATRSAFKLNLTGPAVNVQTACSSSGVALHLACQSLLLGDCDMAIAEGCRVMVPHKVGYLYVDGGTLSKDGKIRAFDAQASGMVRGSGGGAVLLKRLKNAIEDGDHIYAVVKGSAINNDGENKIGFTAPSIQGQAEVLTKAIAMAGIEAESIQYVETHGTGTQLGDPIEMAALTQAFRMFTEKNGFCAIGSVKTNIGHLDAGSFMAGLIKTVLAMGKQSIPASLNYEKPNSQIAFKETPFFVNDTRRDWKKGTWPRRAGISSFGLGGTNAHVIIEEAPPGRSSTSSRPWQILTFSANTELSLDNSIVKFGEFVAADPQLNLADVAYTLRLGRRDFAKRAFFVCKLGKSFSEFDAGQSFITNRGTEIPLEAPFLTFMFPGQGSQHIQMGLDLYRHEAEFTQIIDYCADKLSSIAHYDIRQFFFPHEKEEKSAQKQLTDTRVAQPALFIIEYAMAKVWQSWGVHPSAMIGHSVGDFTAACLAGVFSLDDALALVSMRGTLMADLPKGSMLSVQLEERQLREMLDEDLSLAVVNAPARCVVSGESDKIDLFYQKMQNSGIEVIKLHTSHAFHSPMMKPAVEPFRKYLKEIDLHPPQIPFISGSTGDWITDDQATSPDFWSRQLLLPVLFSKGIREILREKTCVFLETGPGITLSVLVQQQLEKQSPHKVISSWDHSGKVHSAMECTFKALGKLWFENINIDWQSLYHAETRNRVSLPTYSFDRKRYWIEPCKEKSAQPGREMGLQMAAVSSTKPDESAENQQKTALQTDTQPRIIRLGDELREIISELSGLDLEASDDESSFLALGLDSLFLTQLTGRLRKSFDIQLKFRQLLEEYTDIAALSRYLDHELPPDTIQTPLQQSEGELTSNLERNSMKEIVDLQSALSSQQNKSTMDDSVENVIRQQLQVMQAQLNILQNNNITDRGQPKQLESTLSLSRDKKKSAAEKPKTKSQSFGAGTRINKSTSAELTDRQKVFFKEFSRKYIAGTSKSKSHTSKYRSCLADPRVVSGFSPFLKELVYPIVVERSMGSKVWDIDGKEYIDMTNGFGANFLGHSPEFITKAVQEQLQRGVEIGPQHPLAGEVAQLICHMTNLERAIFCNTGSEAVLGAMRIARTVNGRDKVVVFTDDYHGMFDEVIVRGTKTLRSIPAAPGIPLASVENVLVLEYGSQESLQIIKENSDEIAAVLVEPVQSRNLSLQPKEFLHSLRDISTAQDIALIFDEVITGFRSHPGGAQAYFGVAADLATYGKIVGGGMPIGVIAGKAKYMDALDGGEWHFGDASVPEVGVTYFAGTFVRHPLALAAAKATLEYLLKCGPSLQTELNRKTESCVERLKKFVATVKAPIRFLQFSSAFRFVYTDDVPYGGLLYPMLRSKGIHIFEGRTWFFTTSHSDADITAVETAFKDSVLELQAVGFIPSLANVEKENIDKAQNETSIPTEPPVPGARLGKCPDGNPAWFTADPDRPGKYLRVG